MSTAQTAKTRHVTAPSGTKYAYRRLGVTCPGIPLVILTHFRGVMDKFDPLLLNLLASHRSLITVDYSGVGLSTGRLATSIRDSAADILEFLAAIGEKEIDLLGFSLGGMVAQLVALNADPAAIKIRKLILAGTTSSAGEGVVASENEEDVGVVGSVKEVDIETFRTLFFPKNREGEIALQAWWERIHERKGGDDDDGVVAVATFVSQGYADGAEGLRSQGEMIAKWATPDASRGLDGSYDRLGELGIPVLVANGNVSISLSLFFSSFFSFLRSVLFFCPEMRYPC